MYKALFVLLITFIISSISYANDSIPCFKSKKYISYNNLENLTNINIEIIKMDKWLNNAFAIVRNNGWIKKNRSQQNVFWFHQKLDQFIKNDFLSKKGISEKLQKIEIEVRNSEIDPFKAANKLFNYES